VALGPEPLAAVELQRQAPQLQRPQVEHLRLLPRSPEHREFAAEVEEILEAWKPPGPQPQRWAELMAGAPLPRKLEAERHRQQRRPSALPHPTGYPKREVCPPLARRVVLQQSLGWAAAVLLQSSAPAGVEAQSAEEPAVAAREHVALAHPGSAGADPVRLGLVRGLKDGSTHSTNLENWRALYPKSCWVRC
jgi:hypothetical protein